MADYPPQAFMDRFPDLAFMIIADQVTSDYQAFIKEYIAPNLEIFKTKSLRELHVLITLHIAGAPVQPKEIAQLLRYDRATVSRAVKNLIENDLISEKPDENDQRSILLSLTDAGSSIIDHYLDLADKAFSSVRPVLGEYNPREPYMIITSLIKLRSRTQRLEKADFDLEE